MSKYSGCTYPQGQSKWDLLWSLAEWTKTIPSKQNYSGVALLCEHSVSVKNVKDLRTRAHQTMTAWLSKMSDQRSFVKTEQNLFLMVSKGKGNMRFYSHLLTSSMTFPYCQSYRHTEHAISKLAKWNKLFTCWKCASPLPLIITELQISIIIVSHYIVI